MSEFETLPLINRTDRNTTGEKETTELSDPNDYAHKHFTDGSEQVPTPTLRNTSKGSRSSFVGSQEPKASFRLELTEASQRKARGILKATKYGSMHSSTRQDMGKNQDSVSTSNKVSFQHDQSHHQASQS